jgi:hypothetical protein
MHSGLPSAKQAMNFMALLSSPSQTASKTTTSRIQYRYLLYSCGAVFL